jgi:DNA-binding NtrC family response regulator
MRILLVDDEDGLRKLLVRALARAGHEVVEFSNAPEALAWSSDAQPDLLVTDVSLLPVSGMALAESLLERYPALPVVFISGYATEIEAFQRKHPASVFVRKPFSSKELLTAIETVTT